MEKQELQNKYNSLKAKRSNLMKEAECACVELFKQNNISQFVIPVEAIDDAMTVQFEYGLGSIDVIKFNDPSIEEKDGIFLFSEGDDNWFSAEVIDDFDWVELYNLIVKATDFYKSKNVPVSEWGDLINMECGEDNFDEYLEED